MIQYLLKHWHKMMLLIFAILFPIVLICYCTCVNTFDTIAINLLCFAFEYLYDIHNNVRSQLNQAVMLLWTRCRLCCIIVFSITNHKHLMLISLTLLNIIIEYFCLNVFNLSMVLHYLYLSVCSMFEEQEILRFECHLWNYRFILHTVWNWHKRLFWGIWHAASVNRSSQSFVFAEHVDLDVNNLVVFEFP